MDHSTEHSLDQAVNTWDSMMQYLEEGNDMTYGFLQLAKSDLRIPAEELKCEYCRKQIETELKLIETTLMFSRLANEWASNKRLRLRLGVIGRAIPLITRMVRLELGKSF
jgi:hypothetical protein